MRFSILRPMHGWRAFGGEVGIIVLGVLIALGAQQIADTIAWKQQVKDARQALDAELSHSVGAYEHRRSQSDCVARRLDELDQWVQKWSQGEREALAGAIGRIPGFNIWTGVWEVTQAGQVAAHIPVQDRLAYARLYDLLRNFSETRNLEREAWFVLRDYDHADHLEHQDIIRLRGALARVKYLNRVIGQNAGNGFINDTAGQLRIAPEKRRAADPEAEAELCRPIPRKPRSVTPANGFAWILFLPTLHSRHSFCRFDHCKVSYPHCCNTGGFLCVQVAEAEPTSWLARRILGTGYRHGRRSDCSGCSTNGRSALMGGAPSPIAHCDPRRTSQTL